MDLKDLNPYLYLKNVQKPYLYMKIFQQDVFVFERFQIGIFLFVFEKSVFGPNPESNHAFTLTPVHTCIGT